MDKKAIETLSVNAVRDSIVTSDFLDQFIADNDKEPTWDGFVYIYGDKSKKKNKLKGRLPVQIKGTENDDFSKEEIIYAMMFYCRHFKMPNSTKKRLQGQTFFCSNCSKRMIKRIQKSNSCLPQDRFLIGFSL